MERIYCNPTTILDVASDLGLPKKVVEEMVNCQSEYTKVVMESNTFDSIRWPFLGIFKCKPKELQIIQYLQGLTPEQAADFKKSVRTGKIKLNGWEDELKAKRKKKSEL